MIVLFMKLKRKIRLFLKEKTIFGKIPKLKKRIAGFMRHPGKTGANSETNSRLSAQTPASDPAGTETKQNQYIAAVAERTGWPYRYARQQMKDAKNRIGITYKEYSKHGFYDIPKHQQEEEYTKIKKKQAKKARAKNKKYIGIVMQHTGWDKAYAEEMMKKAREATGVSYEHYAAFNFWELTEAEQKTYFVKNDAEMLRDIYNKDPKLLRVFINKDQFAREFEKYLGRAWMYNVRMKFSTFQAKFKNDKKIIYKPRSSTGGSGVTVFDLNAENMRDVFDTLAALPEGIIESYVVQHPDMQKLSLNAVNTIRVCTVLTQDDLPGVEKDKVHFLYAAVRMGRGDSCVDNMHSGGLVAVANIDTGIVETAAVDFSHNVCETHPDTGVPIRGFQIPYFQEIKALIREAGKGIPAYLGWDIAITENGPVVIEVNTHPGAEILQTPYAAEKKGVKYMVEKYLLTENAAAAQGASVLAATETQKTAEKNRFIAAVAEKTGWTYKDARARMKDAKARIGITYSEYNKFNLFNIPEDQQEAEYKKILEQQAKKARAKDEKYIGIVTQHTGWGKSYAEEMMKKSREATGVSYEHYAAFNFWELSEAQQKTYFVKNDAEMLRKIYNKDPKLLRVFINKDQFAEAFEKFLGRAWMYNVKMDFDVFREKFKDDKKIIYKPRSSTGGSGVTVFELNEETIRDVFDTLAAMPEGIIESYVIQHPEMKKLSLNAVNTIRVCTILTKDTLPGVEKDKVHFLYAAVRMGRGDSCVDNMHSGGLVAVANIDTGIVETAAVDFSHNVCETHPDTGVPIRGFQIPYFQEIKALIREAGKGIPAYLGWDIAISEKGPVIIEVNTHPGAEILQTPYAAEKKGVKHMIEKYLVSADTREAETPYGTKISGITKEGIEFYWKKVERADGYEVYRGYKATGPFEKIAVIPRRNIGTHIDADFDRSKKRVYYTVRSFLKSPVGTCVYSEQTIPTEAVFRNELLLERDATYLYSGTARTIRAFYGWGEVEDAQWSSDNEAVATISPDGTIRAIASGECTLTCASQAMGQSATSKVVVDRKACEPLDQIVSRFHYNQQTGFWKNPDAPASDSAVIMMVGDMMCGKKQMTRQYTAAQGWNFNESYTYVKDITAASDFAVGNLETLLASGWPYMTEEAYINNMNNCNATSRYLDAVKYGGFDAVVMANNHNCDGGTRALIETLEQVDRYDFAHTGVFYGESDKRFFIADVNGIKVGYLAYISSATGFNDKDADWDPADKDRLLNVFSAEKAKKDIADCKAAGAEYVIAYMHWGFKNFRNVVKHQIDEAFDVAEAGADYIVGANPHVLQCYDVLKTSDGREVPCAYSIGNFQSVMNQVEGNRDSVILRIRLEKDPAGKVILRENHYIPCYTYNKCEGNRWATVAVSEAFHPNLKKKEKKTIRGRIAAAIGNKLEMF